VRRIGTTTRGYLQLWAMNWAGSAPRWGSLQVTRLLSTESVVVMEWKGMSTSIATRAAPPGRPQWMQGASAKPALLGPMSSD